MVTRRRADEWRVLSTRGCAYYTGSTLTNTCIHSLVLVHLTVCVVCVCVSYLIDSDGNSSLSGREMLEAVNDPKTVAALTVRM